MSEKTCGECWHYDLKIEYCDVKDEYMAPENICPPYEDDFYVGREEVEALMSKPKEAPNALPTRSTSDADDTRTAEDGESQHGRTVKEEKE